MVLRTMQPLALRKHLDLSDESGKSRSKRERKALKKLHEILNTFLLLSVAFHLAGRVGLTGHAYRCLSKATGQSLFQPSPMVRSFGSCPREQGHRYKQRRQIFSAGWLGLPSK